MPRLPQPGGDEGSWGSILNEYLSVSHAADGTLKSQSVIDTVASKYTKPASGIPESDLSSAVVTKLDTTGATTLDELTDVSTASAANGQALVYNGSSWAPATVGSGGGATNLTWTAATATIASDTGTNAVLTPADTSNPGLMSSADKTKLDAVEAGATANQTGAEIKAAYESQADTNAFTDAEQTKLAGIAAGAEANAVDSVNGQTGAVSLDAASLTDVVTAGITDGQVLQWTSTNSRFEPATVSGGGGSPTNLGWVASSGTVTSDTGADAILTPADTSNPGLMSSADKTKLNNLNTNAQAPSGGTTGQVLKKNSATDYDYDWAADDSGGSLGPDSVTATELADNAVDAGAIAAGAVTGAKLASDAVTGVKILNNTITADKLNATVSLTDLDGTKVTGDVSLNSNKLTNLAAPTVAADAATKAYVDASGGGGTQSLGNLTVTAGDIPIDLSVTQSFYVNASENITSVTVTNGPPANTVVEWVLIVAANGANRDITLPAGWRTPGGTKTFTVASGQSRVIAVLETGSATRANISDDLS